MPNIAKVIKITVTGGIRGQPINVINRTTKERINTTLGDTAKAVVDLQNFTNGFSVGDVIDFIVAGERVGQNSLTVSNTTPQTVTITTSAITTGLARGI